MDARTLQITLGLQKPGFFGRELYHDFSARLLTQELIFCKCYDDRDPQKTPLARLIPATAQPPGSMSTRSPATMLEIRTHSQAVLDEIIVSALIVERKRLTPVEGSRNEDLFN